MTFSRRNISNLCLGCLAPLLVVPLTAQTAPAAGVVSIDPANLETHNLKAEQVEYQGLKAVRLTTTSQDASALAVLKGTQFQDGTIEADIAVKITTPPGVRACRDSPGWRFA